MRALSFTAPVRIESEMNRREFDLAEAHRLYLTGLSVHEVGTRFGVCGQTIASRFHKAGIALRGAGWSDGDLQTLRELYAAGERLEVIAARLRRSYYAVALKAARLGISVRRGKQTRRAKAQPQQLSLHATPQNKWDVYSHPRGMSGKTHTKETIRKVSAASRAAWDRMKKTRTGNYSNEQRQRVSDRASAMNAGRTAEQNYSRAKRGFRDDLPGIYFRSAWEANYARYLRWLKERGDIHDWQYEPDTFWFLKIERGVRSYKPDFKVWECAGAEPYYIEVKGWMDKKSATKLRRMAKYYPGVRVLVVDQRAYKATADICTRLVPGWER